MAGAGRSAKSVEAIADQAAGSRAAASRSRPIPAATHAAVALLDELAQFAGIRVVEFGPVHLNLPHDSPCQRRFVPTKALADADVGLLVDVDVPWIPKDMPENPSTWWAHVDVDPEKRAIPMWTFPANLRLQGDSCAASMPTCWRALKARADAGLQGTRRRRA